MPMATQIGGVVRDDYQVKGPWWDAQITSGAQVILARLIRLDGGDRHPEKIAHPITSKVAARASTTMTMSAVLRLCSRNGLKPIGWTVTNLPLCLPSPR